MGQVMSCCFWRKRDKNQDSRGWFSFRKKKVNKPVDDLESEATLTPPKDKRKTFFSIDKKTKTQSNGPSPTRSTKADEQTIDITDHEMALVYEQNKATNINHAKMQQTIPGRSNHDKRTRPVQNKFSHANEHSSPYSSSNKIAKYSNSPTFKLSSGMVASSAPNQRTQSANGLQVAGYSNVKVPKDTRVNSHTLSKEDVLLKAKKMICEEYSVSLSPQLNETKRQNEARRSAIGCQPKNHSLSPTTSSSACMILNTLNTQTTQSTSVVPDSPAFCAPVESTEGQLKLYDNSSHVPILPNASRQFYPSKAPPKPLRQLPIQSQNTNAEPNAIKFVSKPYDGYSFFKHQQNEAPFTSQDTLVGHASLEIVDENANENKRALTEKRHAARLIREEALNNYGKPQQEKLNNTVDKVGRLTTLQAELVAAQNETLNITENVDKQKTQLVDDNSFINNQVNANRTKTLNDCTEPSVVGELTSIENDKTLESDPETKNETLTDYVEKQDDIINTIKANRGETPNDCVEPAHPDLGHYFRAKNTNSEKQENETKLLDIVKQDNVMESPKVLVQLDNAEDDSLTINKSETDDIKEENNENQENINTNQQKNASTETPILESTVCSPISMYDSKASDKGIDIDDFQESSKDEQSDDISEKENKDTTSCDSWNHSNDQREGATSSKPVSEEISDLVQVKTTQTETVNSKQMEELRKEENISKENFSTTEKPLVENIETTILNSDKEHQPVNMNEEDPENTQYNKSIVKNRENNNFTQNVRLEHSILAEDVATNNTGFAFVDDEPNEEVAKHDELNNEEKLTKENLLGENAIADQPIPAQADTSDSFNLESNNNKKQTITIEGNEELEHSKQNVKRDSLNLQLGNTDTYNSWTSFINKHLENGELGFSVASTNQDRFTNNEQTEITQDYTAEENVKIPKADIKIEESFSFEEKGTSDDKEQVEIADAATEVLKLTSIELQEKEETVIAYQMEECRATIAETSVENLHDNNTILLEKAEVSSTSFSEMPRMQSDHDGLIEDPYSDKDSISKPNIDYSNSCNMDLDDSTSPGNIITNEDPNAIIWIRGETNTVAQWKSEYEESDFTGIHIENQTHLDNQDDAQSITNSRNHLTESYAASEEESNDNQKLINSIEENAGADQNIPKQAETFESITDDDRVETSDETTENKIPIIKVPPPDVLARTFEDILAANRNDLVDMHTGDEITCDAYNKAIRSLKAIKRKAGPFEEEIENFTELETSNKYYYINESLKRLVDKLDDMFDDVGDVKALREARKEVYRFIFPMFDRLDEKELANRLGTNS